MSQVDRFSGLTGSVTIKVPVKVRFTTALTLSGEQTVDGVACVEGDRVLRDVSATPILNGIYVVSTGDWTRAPDFDGVRDVVNGTIVQVSQGTWAGRQYTVTTADPITIDTSSITFAFTGNDTAAAEAAAVAAAASAVDAAASAVDAAAEVSDLLALDPLFAGTTNGLSVGYTTDTETLSSDTITPDMTLECIKTRAVAGNVTINLPTGGNGVCHIILTVDGTPRTVTLGSGVKAIGTIPTLAASTTYIATVIRHTGALAAVQIQEIAA